MDQLVPQFQRDVIDDDLARAYAWPTEESAGTARSGTARSGTARSGVDRFLRANMVASLDGVAALDGVSSPLSDADDQRLFGILRDLADVVLVGAGTVRQEGYGPTQLSPGRQSRRKRWTGRGALPYAVVTNTGLDPALSFFDEAPYAARPIVITPAAAADKVRQDRCDLVVAGDQKVDLVVAVNALVDLGFARIQCEGGPSLLGSLITLGLVDELCLSVSPLLIGIGSGPGLIGDTELDGPVTWTLAGLHSGSHSLFARYRSNSHPDSQPGTSRPDDAG